MKPPTMSKIERPRVRRNVFMATQRSGSDNIRTLVLIATAWRRILRILHVALVGRGDTLHDVAVAVVAGDADARAGKLLLDVHVRGEVVCLSLKNVEWINTINLRIVE